MSVDIENVTEESLAALNPEQLIRMVVVLHEENKKLQTNVNETVSKKYDERLERLEREVNKDKQYGRRDSIEIVGISPDVHDDNIENECINILKAAKVKVGNKFPSTLDIHAAHRKNRKGHVIIKFTNRKWAEGAMRNRASLKDSNYANTFLNQSLCPEFAFLAFAVRKAKASGQIDFWKLKHGIPMIKLTPDGDFVEISHENDLVANGITVPNRMN